MKKPVDYKVRRMVAKDDPLLGGLPTAGLERDRDISEESAGGAARGKRENVRRLVLLAKPAIEIAEPVIIGKEERAAAAGPRFDRRSGSHARARKSIRVSEFKRPALVFDDDVEISKFVDHRNEAA
jgi:hypothetical protein